MPCYIYYYYYYVYIYYCNYKMLSSRATYSKSN